MMTADTTMTLPITGTVTWAARYNTWLDAKRRGLVFSYWKMPDSLAGVN